ncbi:hypothetical protein [Allonocardiopsis opalescens]|uniref:Uncharacterized protein n=1 Tax=Allonocardiopsis opalescens TaxID=1144618 RepID=A0A2T0Q4W9_9ACTN|nr:hypothetical protein [Allonocardiopsis opalescens]PRX98799.1 hypothetical protein CLV72_104379 [Allonocardiopsis opalescens]
METEAGAASRPTPEEAARVLDQIGRDRDAVRRLPAPAWYFPAVAAMVAAAHLSQLLPSPVGALVALAVVAAAVLAVRRHADALGVVGWSVPPRIWLPMGALIATAPAAAVLDQVYGQRWAWIAAAALGAGAVLAWGALHRRAVERGA